MKRPMPVRRRQNTKTALKIATLGLFTLALASSLLLFQASPAYADEPLTVHMVSPGETLSHVSLRYGVPIQDILKANGLSDPNYIVEGWTLSIPSAKIPTTEREGTSAADGVQNHSSRWPPNGWLVESLTPTLHWDGNGYAHLRVKKAGEEMPLIDVVLMPGQDSYAIPLTAPLSPGATYAWKVRTNPFPPAQSPYTWSPWSAEWTFRAPGTASWQDTALVPLASPGNGTITSTVDPSLRWSIPPGATQYHLQVLPGTRNAAGLSVIRNTESSYHIPGPPSWYGMLPGMTYSWRVRVSNAQGYVPPDHPSWGPWSETWSFRTPQPSSITIAPRFPANGSRVSGLTPTLAWQDNNGGIFYYEIQISKDPDFITDPIRARAPVYWEYRHGGMTAPLNSYSVSQRYPLEPGSTYYWRVRPRVEASATGVPWSPTWTFVVPQP